MQTKTIILKGLLSVLLAWCIAWTAGGTFSVGAWGGGCGTITYEGTTEAAGTGTSVSINVPAEVADGDIMILSAISDTVDVPPVLPEGWTSIATVSTSSTEQVMGYRICSSEPASYNVTAGSSAPLVVIIGGFSKSAGTWGIDDSGTSTSNSVAVNTLQSGTVTMIASSMYVVAFGNDGNVVLTDIDAGLTEVAAHTVLSANLYMHREACSAGDKYVTSTWASTEQVSSIAICLSAN